MACLKQYCYAVDIVAMSSSMEIHHLLPMPSKNYIRESPGPPSPPPPPRQLIMPRLTKAEREAYKQACLEAEEDFRETMESVRSL